MPEQAEQAEHAVPLRGVRRLSVVARQNPTLRREADMMGFTVCIALIAVLSAGSDHAPHSRLDVMAIVWATTLGLALTHWFALMLSMRLVPDPTFRFAPAEMLFAQTAMVLLVTTTATLVVLLVPKDFDRLSARITAAVFLGLLVGFESRVGGASWRRVGLFVATALVIGLAIAAAKWFLST